MYAKFERKDSKKLNNLLKQANFNRIISEVNSNQLYIGIPQSKTKVEGDSGVTNVELAFIHNNGSPKKGIPKRPIFKSFLSHYRDSINKEYMEYSKMLTMGKYDEARIKLERIGGRFSALLTRWFTNPENGWAPNSPATIARKRRKGRSEGSIWPLVDTRELAKSMSYVIRRKGGK